MLTVCGSAQRRLSFAVLRHVHGTCRMFPVKKDLTIRFYRSRKTNCQIEPRFR